MRRFFVPLELSRGEVFELPEREARHATQVLRLEAGDELTVLDGAGGVMECVVEATTKRSVRVTVRKRDQRAPLPCPITLVQAIPKGPAFETIVQKATELGAARIIPLLSERVVVHISEKDAAAKVEKWNQIAIESIKQCGSPWLPFIEPPVSFGKLAERAYGEEFAVVASLEPGSRHLREALAGFLASKKHQPKSTVVWIGPEGDFTSAEYAAIAKLGAFPITLGPLILRADTAAIATLSVLNYEIQGAV
jgi:16S rRNA (uracil1498-N3)-methyltransferase